MNISWNVIEQSRGTTLKLMSCLCRLHIFTQTIVMEMITRPSLRVEREASLQLNVWDANGGMEGGASEVEQATPGSACIYFAHLCPSRG